MAGGQRRSYSPPARGGGWAMGRGLRVIVDRNRNLAAGVEATVPLPMGEDPSVYLDRGELSISMGRRCLRSKQEHGGAATSPSSCQLIPFVACENNSCLNLSCAVMAFVVKYRRILSSTEDTLQHVQLRSFRRACFRIYLDTGKKSSHFSYNSDPQRGMWR